MMPNGFYWLVMKTTATFVGMSSNFVWAKTMWSILQNVSNDYLYKASHFRTLTYYPRLSLTDNAWSHYHHVMLTPRTCAHVWHSHRQYGYISNNKAIQYVCELSPNRELIQVLTLIYKDINIHN